MANDRSHRVVVIVDPTEDPALYAVLRDVPVRKRAGRIRAMAGQYLAVERAFAKAGVGGASVLMAAAAPAAEAPALSAEPADSSKGEGGAFALDRYADFSVDDLIGAFGMGGATQARL